jgi:hypothetical protein
MPALTGTLGQVDATALAEIQQYRKAIGATQWAGMQGTGTISQGNQGQLNATLSVLGGNSFRLDVAAPQGVRSVRITDVNGQIQESDGRKHILPAANAKNGILAFPHLLSSTFPEGQTTILDHGIVQIEGHALHRITLVEVVSSDDPASEEGNISVLDLYFDPTSHLLIKSADYVQLDNSDRQHYVRVVTYGDYREVNRTLIPHQYSQTLNGQKQWTLQLTEVHPSPATDASYFLF